MFDARLPTRIPIAALVPDASPGWAPTGQVDCGLRVVRIAAARDQVGHKFRSAMGIALTAGPLRWQGRRC